MNFSASSETLCERCKHLEFEFQAFCRNKNISSQDVRSFKPDDADFLFQMLSTYFGVSFAKTPTPRTLENIHRHTIRKCTIDSDTDESENQSVDLGQFGSQEYSANFQHETASTPSSSLQPGSFRSDQSVGIPEMSIEREPRSESRSEPREKNSSNYRMIRKFKSGTHNVYFAKQTQTGRLVVAKAFMRNGNYNDEIETMKMLRNVPEFVNYIETVCEEIFNVPHHYIITEYVPGASLDDIATICPNFSTKDFEIIAKQLIRMVAKLHRMNITHGDIKPENIIMRNNSIHDLVLIDFGCAEYHKPNNLGAGLEFMKFLSNKIIGTPYFLAPESTHQGKVNRQSMDIWALGVTLLLIVKCKFVQVSREMPSIEQIMNDLHPVEASFFNSIFSIIPQNRTTCEALLEHELLSPSRKTTSAGTSSDASFEEKILHYPHPPSSNGKRGQLEVVTTIEYFEAPISAITTIEDAPDLCQCPALLEINSDSIEEDSIIPPGSPATLSHTITPINNRMLSPEKLRNQIKSADGFVAA